MNNQQWIIGRRAGALTVLVVLALAAGCVSTPARRIARHPELFAGYPPAVQAQIRRGEIDIGFTPDMVRLALGEPSRVLARQTAAGATDVWNYTAFRYDPTMRPVWMGYAYRGRDGRIVHVDDPGFAGVDTREEYVVLRIEFENGKVRAIERLK